jgi:hypothetical protein
MASTTGHFHNEYTFAIVDHPGGFETQLPLIQANALAVINYLSDFISWKGTMQFYVRFGSPFQNGADGTGLLPAYGGVAPEGDTYAASKAFTGVDANGSDGDAGAWLLPNANGTLTNHGAPLSFDPSPDPYEKYFPPPGTNDFFSIYLHEVMHGFGFWSLAQHGPTFGQSRFDAFTQENNGVFEFVGPHVQALLGQNLQLAKTGSRDHYGGVAQNLPDHPFIDRGLMWEFGDYEQNRWHLGQLDLAVLADLGWTTANEFKLPVVERRDQKSRNDFDADGKSDILFRQNSGVLWVTEMNGLAFKAGDSPGTYDDSENIAGTGDFDGDLKADILARFHDNSLFVTLMDGTTFKDGDSPGAFSPAAEIKGIGDFDGDARDDILSRFATRCS